MISIYLGSIMKIQTTLLEKIYLTKAGGHPKMISLSIHTDFHGRFPDSYQLCSYAGLVDIKQIGRTESAGEEIIRSIPAEQAVLPLHRYYAGQRVDDHFYTTNFN